MLCIAKTAEEFRMGPHRTNWSFTQVFAASTAWFRAWEDGVAQLLVFWYGFYQSVLPWAAPRIPPPTQTYKVLNWSALYVSSVRQLMQCAVWRLVNIKGNGCFRKNSPTLAHHTYDQFKGRDFFPVSSHLPYNWIVKKVLYGDMYIYCEESLFRLCMNRWHYIGPH